MADVDYLVERQPDKPDFYWLRGSIYYKWRFQTSARGFYARLVELDSDKAYGHWCLAKVVIAIDQQDRGLVQFDAAIALEPETPAYTMTGPAQRRAAGQGRHVRERRVGADHRSVDAGQGQSRLAGDRDEGGMAPGFSGLGAATIRAAVEGSLKRLQVEHIDLYYAHRDDPDTPVQETLAAFDALVRGGKVSHVAASNYSAPGWRRRWPSPTARAMPASSGCSRTTTSSSATATRATWPTSAPGSVSRAFRTSRWPAAS